MVRPLRIEYPGGVYHVTSRGNRREEIFLSNDDKELFLRILGDTCEKNRWYCHAYCLMSNHYHLLIETPLGNLSKGMQYLNGVYTQKFNRVHQRVGHVFQGRYKAILVEKDSYLLELSRYIVLNPVRAKMVSSASKWPWSSYLFTINELTPPKWLNVNILLESFNPNKTTAIGQYKQFVDDGVNGESPWSNLKNQIYLGSDEFVNKSLGKIVEIVDKTYIPKIHFTEVIEKRPLKEYESISNERDEAIYLAYSSGQYSLKEIGNHFGLHYSRISRIVGHKNKKAKDKA